MRMTNLYCREHRKVDQFLVDRDYLDRQGLTSVCFQPEAGKKMMVTAWQGARIFKRYPVQEVWIKRSGIEWKFDVPIGKIYVSWDQVTDVEVEEYEENFI